MKIVIDKRQIERLLKYAAPSTDMRGLAGICINLNDGKPILEATNGHRLVIENVDYIGEYPDVCSIARKPFEAGICLQFQPKEADLFIHHLRAVKVMADHLAIDKRYGSAIRLMFRNERIVIATDDKKTMRSFRYDVPECLKGFNIGFNARYLLDALESALSVDHDFELYIDQPLLGIAVKPVLHDFPLHMVMPMLLSGGKIS